MENTHLPATQHPSTEDKALAAIAYLGPLSILSFFVGKTAFVRFHAKQGLALFLTALVVSLALRILALLLWPGYHYGYGMMMGGGFLGAIYRIALAVAMIAGVIKSIEGVEWRMPFISEIAKKF